MSRTSSQDRQSTLGVLIQLARPYKTRFIAIALLSLFATGADLLQPLIYRVAINDVAGLFVDRPPDNSVQGPPPAPVQIERQRRQLERLERTQEPHRPDYVAPRTRRQTLTTLLWAVSLLFAIGVTGYFLSLAADLESTAVAGAIEANLIQSTFGHVLRLPLSFLARLGNLWVTGGLSAELE
jgi:ABC-type multidrug transport system fused ATPase/permease subunit